MSAVDRAAPIGPAWPLRAIPNHAPDNFFRNAPAPDGTGFVHTREQSEALQCVLKEVIVHRSKHQMEVFELEEFQPSSQKRKGWLPVILAGSSLYPFVLMSLRTAIYIGWGAVLFAFPLQGANWLGALLVLAASVLAFSGLGILSASYLLIFKRGNPVNWAILGISTVVGGMMYPISVLPVWLQYVGRITPVTYSLEGMRAAILGHASNRELLPSIAGLLLFAALLLPTSFAIFSWALRRTKITGTLTHF